ncbi:MAG: DUF4360 domain-containing protein [Oligoflexia bacterium]|nr:DUF4360 domain-containing protein [Oligoflexia bacterium]
MRLRLNGKNLELRNVFKLALTGLLFSGIMLINTVTDANAKSATDNKHFTTPIFGTPQAAGTACPGGVINYEYFAEEGRLVLSLEGYMAMAGGSSGKRLDRKTCNIAIPVSMPKKVSIGLAVKPLNGWAQLPLAASAKARAEAFFAGTTGVVVERDFTSVIDSNYFDSGWDTFDEENSTIWSPCGVNSNLRLNTSLLVKTNSALEEAIAEFGPSIDLEIKFRSCE